MWHWSTSDEVHTWQWSTGNNVVHHLISNENDNICLRKPATKVFDLKLGESTTFS